MRRKKKNATVDYSAIARKSNPAFWNHPVGDSESQYTEKCYNGSPLYTNKSHYNFEEMARKNRVVVI
jgi:hypothetical protein